MTSRWAVFAFVMLVGCRTFAESSSADSVAEASVSDAPDASSDASHPGAGPPTSCKDLLDRNAEQPLADGFYEIDPDGAGRSPPIKVFCDMTLDGGGWTLVARSAPIEDARRPVFGWKVATGSVEDMTQPYSLDVGTAKLDFKEVLLADRAAVHVYKFAVPTNFVTSYETGVMPTGVVKVLGGCDAGEGAPSMLSFAGATSLKDVYFLRDNKSTDLHLGLKANGFDLMYDDCQGGLLNDQQGMILVR